MEEEFFAIIDDWLSRSTWTEKIAMGMQLIAAGCDNNKSATFCEQCPFCIYCNAIQYTQEKFKDLNIPETWWH